MRTSHLRQRLVPLTTGAVFVAAFVIAVAIAARAIRDREALAQRVHRLEASRAQACLLVESRLDLSRSIADRWLAGRGPRLEPDRARLLEDLVQVTVHSDPCLYPLPEPTVRAIDGMFAGTLADDVLAQGIQSLDDALLRQAHKGWPLRPD